MHNNEMQEQKFKKEVVLSKMPFDKCSAAMGHLRFCISIAKVTERSTSLFEDFSMRIFLSAE